MFCARFSPLFGGAHVPEEGFFGIPFGTVAVFQAVSQKQLGTGMAALRGPAIPIHRPDVIFGNALPERVHQSEAELRPGIAILCQRIPLGEGGGIVGAVVGRQSTLVILPEGGSWMRRPQT